jgi:hypothetical protein
MTPDELETLVLESEDSERLRAAFASLDEKERAKLSSAAQKLFNQLYRNKAEAGASDRLKAHLATRTGDLWNYWNAKENSRATLALFALCPISVVKKRDVRLWDEAFPTFDRIIRDRRPEWIDDWIAHELEPEISTQLDFGILRGWVRDGVCRKPIVDGYYRTFAWYLMRTGFYQRGENVPPITVQLLADPALLEDIEGLFRVESIAFNTNAWLTKGAAPDYQTWPDALVKLSAEGHLERDYLLGLALEGLTRDLKQNQLSGFHGFYKRMAPERAELLRHQQGFVDLLCHPVGHVVKFAIDMLAEVEKQGALDTGPALREIQAVFSSEGKGNAIAALKLIKRVIARQKSRDSETLGVLCEALRHAHPDVQTMALDLLETTAGQLDEARRDMLRGMEAFVAASNRPRLAKLLGDDAQGAREAVPAVGVAAPDQPSAYQPISGDLGDHSVLAPGDEITRIETVDALIAALLHAVEVVDSPDEVERIVDAISRLAHDRPADLDTRVAPLLHRIKTGRGSNSIVLGNVGVGGALLDLIYTWATGTLYRTTGQDTRYYILEDAFVPMIAHLRTIADRVVRRQRRELLSAPTHKGGWIDPLVWIERLHGAHHEAGVAGSMDFRLSLLRLAPDNRAAALVRVSALAPPLGRIARFALGGDELPTRSDRANYPAWITAARCRGPLHDWSAEFAPFDLDDIWPDSLGPAHYMWRSSHKPGQHEQTRWKTPEFTVSIAAGEARDKGDAAGGFLDRIVRAVAGRIATDWALLPSAALARRMEAKHYWSGELNTTWVTQWLAYLWPQNPAAAHIKGALKLTGRMDENSSNWNPGFGYFLALFQHGRPWHEPGHLLLCLGLAGKDADAKGLAIDALIEGIEGKMFDPSLFASVIARLAEGEWVKFNRLGDALMPALQVSGLHAAVVSQALQLWLPLLDLQQKNAFRLLEVLVEAQALTQRPLSADARDALARIAGGGKSAKIVRQLLNI